MNKYLCLIGLLALGACSKDHSIVNSLSAPVSAPVVSVTEIPIIVVMGQSNAVGLGQPTATPLPPGVLWRGLDFPRGIGPAFATRFQKRYGYSQVIIAQCSVGGTTIEEQRAYIMTQCEQIIGNIQRDYPTAKPAVLLFWQGEADAKVSNVPWAEEFMGLVAQFRGAVGQSRLPVVFCQLNSNQFFNQAPLYPFWDYIKQQQAGVSISGVAITRTDDILDIVDSLHVGAEGLSTIGARMFGTYEDLI